MLCEKLDTPQDVIMLKIMLSSSLLDLVWNRSPDVKALATARVNGVRDKADDFFQASFVSFFHSLQSLVITDIPDHNASLLHSKSVVLVRGDCLNHFPGTMMVLLGLCVKGPLVLQTRTNRKLLTLSTMVLNGLGAGGGGGVSGLG